MGRLGHLGVAHSRMTRVSALVATAHVAPSLASANTALHGDLVPRLSASVDIFKNEPASKREENHGSVEDEENQCRSVEVESERDLCDPEEVDATAKPSMHLGKYNFVSPTLATRNTLSVSFAHVGSMLTIPLNPTSPSFRIFFSSLFLNKTPKHACTMTPAYIVTPMI